MVKSKFENIWNCSKCKKPVSESDLSNPNEKNSDNYLCKNCTKEL